MSSEVFEMISMIAFVLAGILFVFSIFWWFKFDIWGIIGDLSGRTAKKSIARMREDNEKNVNFSLNSLKKENKNTEEIITVKKVNKDDSNSDISTKETDSLKKVGMGAEIEDTTVLDKNKIGTLSETVRLDLSEKPIVVLEMIQNIVLVHTEERI